MPDAKLITPSVRPAVCHQGEGTNQLAGCPGGTPSQLFNLETISITTVLYRCFALRYLAVVLCLDFYIFRRFSFVVMEVNNLRR